MATGASTRSPHVNEIGITELYTPSEPHEIVADVVFVHGLKGHPHRTWHYGKLHHAPEGKTTKSSLKSYLPFKRSKNRDIQPVSGEASETLGSCYWPWDLLPSDFENIRILVYGYESDPSHFYKAPTQMNISQHGRNLLEEVVSRRNKCKTRPIIFVAHSLGGIIVKDAIVESRKYVQQPRMQEVANSCRAIFFFGTPHSGADAAEWGIVLSNIVGTIPLGPSTYKEILRGLSPDSEKLDNLTRDFNDILNADIPIQQKIKIFSFQEGKGMTGVARFDGKVVPEGSSGLFARRDIENSISINENHVNMCRFRSKLDSGYNIFKHNLEIYLEDIHENTSGPQDRQQTALLDRLDYPGRHIREDQLWEIRANSETFQWVWDSSFPEWLSGKFDLFWICGNPATGKSTLMHHIAKSDHLQTWLKKGYNKSWTVVYHFFFDFGAERDNRNNFEGFLRCLLYQLVEKLQGEDALRDVVGSSLLAMNRQPWSIQSLQESLTIVLKRHSNPICMLLDGLDEYSGNKWDLVDFLKGVTNSHVKICVASRPSPEFNATFEDVPTIKMQDMNRSGIEKLVTLTIQSSMARSGFYDDEDIVQLADKISEKSNGMFLWARFAINEIRDGWAEGLDLMSLRKKLVDVPMELEQIYARIFKKLKPEQRQEAAHMLQLVCYAINSLRLEDLYVATLLAAGGQSCSWQQITHPVIERFKKRIVALTGGLLQIFGEFDTVNVIHKTVRTFLDSQGWSQLLGAPHEGFKHAEVLWLRVCAALFPISFKELPPIQEEYRGALEKMRVRQDIPGAAMYQPFLQAAADSGNMDLADGLSPLMEYSADCMLPHAYHVEKRLDLDSYHLLQPGISDSFVSYHMLCRHYRNSNSSLGCFCIHGPEPLDFVHLAIAHQLERYLIDFLSVFRAGTSPYTPEWNEVFYLEVPYNEHQCHEKASASDYFQMSLLEFALHHTYFPLEDRTSEPRIISTLLECYSTLLDADLIFALEYANPYLVKLLLPYWPTGKMIFKPDPKRFGMSDPKRFGMSERYGLSLRIPESFKGEFTVGPLWYIIGGIIDSPGRKGLIDIFLQRGEDLNDLCCPAGTALHAVILWLDRRNLEYKWPLVTTLITRGADVNVNGPFGKPLELAWQLACEAEREHTKSKNGLALAIRELIQHGAINSKCDPDGVVPTKDSMLAYCDQIDEEYERIVTAWDSISES